MTVQSYYFNLRLNTAMLHFLHKSIFLKSQDVWIGERPKTSRDIDLNNTSLC